MDDAINIAKGNDINPYSSAHRWQNFAQAVRQDTASDINKATGNAALPYLGTTFGDVYQALMSGADSLVGAGLGGTTYGILMGMGAASSEAKELYEKGASVGQMAAGGILAGAAEMVFEKVSIDKFVKMGDTKSMKTFLVNTLKQGGIEASEEMLTEIANTITDAVVMGSQSDWQGYIDQYVEQGYSESEAIVKALFNDVAPNVINAGIGGLISGGGMGSIGSIGSYANYQSQVKKHGQGIIKEGGVDTLKALALDMAGVKDSPNAKSIGKLAGKVDSKASAKNVGRLSAKIEETMGTQNTADIQTALTEKGLSKSEAKRVSALLTSNETLTEEQIAEIEGNEKIAEVVNELVNNKDSVVNQRKLNLLAARLGVDMKNSTINAKSTKAGDVALKNDVDVSEKLSEEGKTIKVSTGEAITINKNDAIAKTKVVNGERKVYYNTDHGVVEATDVTYANKEEGLLFEGFSDMNPAFANAAIKNYDNSVPVETYIKGMREGIVLYGMHNFQAVGKDISRNSDLAELSEADQSFALKLGRAYAKANANKSEKALKTAIKNAAERAEAEGKTSDTSHKKGKVRFESGVNGGKLNRTQRRTVSLAKYLAEAIGIDIVFYDAMTTTDKNGKGANGYFDPKDNSIHLDLQNAATDSKTIAFTLSHELVHFIKKWSPAKYNTFSKFLMEQYAAHGVSTSTLLANKMAALGTTDADEAYEEMIADACERMLLDSNAVVKLMELRKADLELFDKIKLHVLELLNKIRDAFKGVDPNTDEGIALQKMEDVLGKLHEMFEDAAVDAAKNYQSIGARNLEDFSDAKNTNGEPLFQYKAMQADENTYRTMLKKWGKMTDAQVDNLFDTIDSAMELIKDNLEVLDYAWDADIDDRAFSPVKPNSDKLYQVSLDFSTLCRKRILQQTIQAQLQEALNQPLTKAEGIAIRDALIALQEEGRQIEVACALCYVESARMKSPEQIRKFVENREAVIKEFFAGKSGGSMKEKLSKAETDARERLHKENPNGIKGKDGSTMLDPRTAKLNQLPKKYADVIRSAKKEAKASYVPTSDEQRLIDIAKGMTVSDFTSPEGLENLAKNYRDLFDAYTSYVRNATKSKGIESDTWWRAGDSMQIGDVLIANMNRENGLRSQSWSDFQVVHILDYIAATIELATRNTKEQAYTKVPDFAELMGQTGVMINLSLIPTAKFNGKLEYDSVEGIDYKRSLELRDKYHSTVGTICIGIDNVQIQMLLDDVTVDYVIPYHKSGMSAVVRKAMHIPTWSQYEEYQSEKSLSRAEAKKQADRYGVKLLAESDPNYQKGTSFSEWFDLREAQQIAKMENANPSDKAKHKKYGVMYGGYMAMQNAANNYLKLCAERGLSPKFSHEKADFTAEDNYWKLLIDRKMVDNVTGEVIEQQTIKPIFDEGEIMRILNDELERYPKVKADQDYAIRTVTEKMLSGEVKGGMSAEAIAKVMKKPVDNVTNVNILASSEEVDAGIKKQVKKKMTEEEQMAGEKLADFIDSVSKMLDQSKISKRKLKIGVLTDAHKKIVEELMREINPNFSATGYELWIDGTGADHIIIRHGENGEHDHTMATREDRELIPWAANSPDGGEFIRDGSGKLMLSNRFFNADDSKAPQIRLHKMVDGDTMYISECVLDSKNKRIYITSAYKKLADKQKGSTNQLLNIDSNEPPQPTSETSFDGSATNGSISHPDDSVKSQLKKTTSYAPTFYSQMGNVIDDIKMEKIGTASIVNYLKGKGIKNDEIKWSGIEAFLEGKKSVTKAELQEFIAGSQLIIEEEMGSGEEEETRWDDYKLAGGSNYRELVFKMPNSSYSNRAMRGHWGEDAEGVLVHARIQDFVVDGKKMLFIEELQSDWHNEGMEKGYTTEEYEDAVATYDSLADDYAKKRKAFNQYVRSSEFRSDPDDVSKKKFDWLRGKMETAEKRMQEAERHIDSLKKKGMGDVADAPFRETYHEYVLKRLLRMAAEEGYDSIGWTPADIQSKRWSYDYEKAYKIEYDQEMPKFLRKYGKRWGATVGKATVGAFEEQFDIDPQTSMDDDSWLLAEGVSFEGTEVWSMDITDSMKESVLYEGQPMFQKKTATNRTLLANALESAAQNDIERNKITQYKEKISLIELEQAKLAEVREKANELRRTKGKTPDETKQMKALDFEARQIENRITTYDRQLLNLESTAALKNVLQREKEMARKRAEQKGKEALAKYKETAAETMRELMDRNTKAREKNVEGRKKTVVRTKIKDIVSDLNALLLNPTKDKHVPIGLQKPVAAALDIINMDTVGADERVAKYDALIAKAKDPDVIASLKQSRDRIALQGENLADKLTALKAAYAEIKNSEDQLVKNSHNEAIESLIENTIDVVGNTSLRDMSLKQLEAVYDMFKAIKATVRNANKMFKEGRQETVTENSEKVKTEVKAAGGHRERVLKATKWLKKAGWDMLKPLQAMKVIGSNTFEKLFENVRKGEDTWATDVNEAKNFFIVKSKQYGYDSWDFKKQYTFNDSTGTSFSLSLEQIMSLYAYSKREQADKHLEVGGFIFDDAIEVTEKGKFGIPLKYEVNDANPYRLRKEDLGAVIGILDTELKDVKGFVDDMQAYLSDVMGEKGNEVSLAMYDIKLYNEKHYFPLKTARYFREFDPEKNGTPKIKNSGFSKKTVPKAGNPIVLSNFMDVWANHVNDMSMYHSFVLPLEDFMRVYNYSSTAGGYDSVQQYIKNAYGSQANQYIERLMEDLNGGARVDPSAGIINKGIGLFKKAAVFASASVVIQQPSAMARATAYIDPKYFVDKPKVTKHKETWAEVKKYAPVAIIKEMGYFDTNMGRSTVDWIKDQKTVMDKIDDIASKAPALADELAWCTIWKAVKREVADTTKLEVGSEDFLKRAGERFTEVITNTQVYDSVLSRSGMMRSKDTGMKMATAFMAEPTTALNMVVDAVIQGKRGSKKFAAKTIGAVASSIILNSILVSLVYAARDDDEDETYTEKYLASLTTELIDGFNPLTYIPFVKDIWSIAQGYDVERSDMSIVGNFWESIENLFNDNKSGFEKTEGVVGAIASFFGLPVKNLMRDARAMYNLTISLTSGTPTTKAGVADAVGEAAKSTVPLWTRIEKWAGAADSKSDNLYDAIVSGDRAHIERLKSGYKDEKAISTAIRTGLRENDSRIKDAAQARIDGDILEYTRIVREIIAEGNFVQDIVVGAVNAEINSINSKADVATEEDDETEKATSIYRGSDINDAFESGDNALAVSIIDDLINTKVANGMEEKSAKSSVKSSITSYWKPLYIAAYKAGDTEEMRRIRMILAAAGLYGRASDILETCRAWLQDKN